MMIFDGSLVNGLMLIASLSLHIVDMLAKYELKPGNLSSIFSSSITDDT